MAADTTTADTASIPTQPDRKLIAPVWHTVALIAVLDGLALLGWLAQYMLRRMHLSLPPDPRPVPLYIWSIIFELVSVAWVWFGVRRRGVRITDLIAGRWQNLKSVLVDMSLGAGLWVLWIGAWQAEQFLLGTSDSPHPVHFPVGLLETSLWIGVSLSAGICEEIVFRGYLQKQFQLMTGNWVLGVLLQATAFGIAHLDGSFTRVAMVTLYGAVFGLLARWRQSLRPGIIAHVLTDIAARLLRI